MKKNKAYVIIAVLSIISFILTSCVPESDFETLQEIVVRQDTMEIENGVTVFDFGNVFPDGEGNKTSGYVVFEIENTGDMDLVISSVTINQGDTDAFDIVDSTFSTLPKNMTTTFSIRFDPPEAGKHTATVTIANNDGDEGTFTFTVQGTGKIPYINAEYKKMAPNAEVGDNFGNSVAVSGDYFIVGARGKDDSEGAAYIFHKTGPGTWDQGTQLSSLNPEAGGYFGYSVAISGDYAIVGAYNEDSDSVVSAGVAYIFHRTGINTWDTGVKITASDLQGGDLFGYSVSIDGDYAIVGAQGEDGGDDDPLSSAGAAYIFHRTGTNTWDTGVKITASDLQEGDHFGNSVSIDGDYAIVGAYGEDGGAGNTIIDAGAAYIFHRTGTNTWDSGTRLGASDALTGDRFGNSVAIHGDYAIAGASFKDVMLGAPTGAAGAVYIFRRIGVNTWEPSAKLTAPDMDGDDRLGTSVSIHEEYVIAGAYHEDGGTGNTITDAGAAYVFCRTGTNAWDFYAKLAASDVGAEDSFGYSVAVGEEYAIAGAYCEDGGEGDPTPNTGAVYLFE